MNIENIVQHGESETIEFKSSFGDDAIETTGAFANTSGGMVLIGVEDDGTIKGTTIGKKTMKDWANQISQVSEPTLIPSINSVDIDGKTVVVISVKVFPLKPVAIRGRCYRRVDSSNKKMPPAEISEMHLQSIGTTWDTYPHPDEKLDNIDLQQVKKYASKANKTGRRDFKDDEDPVSILHKIKLIKEGKPTWASVIAFGESPPLQAKVKCGKIRGTSTIVDDFVVDAPLLDQVDEVMGYMKRVLQLSYVISGKAERDEIWEYPLDAVREAVTNAICHRDYTSPAQIQIKIFDDRLNIWNPGGLPFGMSVEKLMDPDHSSVPRNTLIAMLFYETKLIENYGSGIDRILDNCKELGFPAPEFQEFQGGFMVTFHKDVYNEESLTKMGLNERQIKAMFFVKEKGKITNKEYREITGLSDEGARKDLNVLVSKSLIEPKGSGRGAHYTLRKSGD